MNEAYAVEVVGVAAERLPAGYTSRPLRLEDAEAAADLSNAYNIELTGMPNIDAGELRSDWGQPTMKLDANTLAVFAADGGLAGYAEVWDSEPHVRPFVFAEVHPQRRGRGIGTALARWAEARGRELMAEAPADARVVLRQFKMDADAAAARLLHDQGYAPARYNLQMVIEFDGPPPAPVAPDGLVIRPFVRGREERALVAAVREAFRDHWGHVDKPFEEEYQEWLHWLDTSPSADPELAFVAVDGDEIAGTALCHTHWPEDPDMGWVHALGVRRPWRRRGLGRALLQQCFVALHGRGKRRAGLGVDAQSLTGATRLYESAGMHMHRRYVFYEKVLREGRDLTTQAVE